MLMKRADYSEAEWQEFVALEARIGRVHMRQRLDLEKEHEAQVVRCGWRRFGLDALYSSPGLIRAALKLTGLHARGRLNVLNIQRRDNNVWLKRLPPVFDGYTLLHLSDLHLDMSEAYLDRLIERMHGLTHDVCVLTGDFRFRTFGPYAPALKALARLRPHLGEQVYAVLGNHDTIRMVPGMEALGIQVLMNESVRIERSGETLMLVGIDDAHHFRTHDLPKATADVAHGACAILLSHTPEPYRHAALADFSLMLSGHTHGGQICLPGGRPIFTESGAPRALARGPWRHDAMVGYTSVGCGSSIIDVRLNCLPEITLHRLHCG